MTDSPSWPGAGIVLLPVPLEIVQQVAQYAAALGTGRDLPVTGVAGQAGADVTTVTVTKQGRWSQDMVVRLVDVVTYTGVLALLDDCARCPGEWVAKAQVESVGGFTPIQLRNELGAFSKKTRTLFGEVTWPVEWKKERGSYFYRMDPTMAQWWTLARTNQTDQTGHTPSADRTEVN